MSNVGTDYIVKNDIKRYKKNGTSSWLCYLSLVFLCLYFLILYANRVGSFHEEFTESVLGTTQVYSYVYGVDVVLNLLVLLFGFYTAVKLGGYSKVFTYVSYVLGAIQIGRIFLIPFTFRETETLLGAKMVDNYTFVWLVCMLAISAALFIVAGVLGYLRTSEREKFQVELDNGEIDLEKALKDESDDLSKDETPLDIFGDDLDGKKTGDGTDESDELIDAEMNAAGGDV